MLAAGVQPEIYALACEVGGLENDREVLKRSIFRFRDQGSPPLDLNKVRLRRLLVETDAHDTTGTRDLRVIRQEFQRQCDVPSEAERIAILKWLGFLCNDTPLGDDAAAFPILVVLADYLDRTFLATLLPFPCPDPRDTSSTTTPPLVLTRDFGDPRFGAVKDKCHTCFQPRGTCTQHMAHVPVSTLIKQPFAMPMEIKIVEIRCSHCPRLLIDSGGTSGAPDRICRLFHDMPLPFSSDEVNHILSTLYQSSDAVRATTTADGGGGAGADPAGEVEPPFASSAELIMPFHMVQLGAEIMAETPLSPSENDILMAAIQLPMPPDAPDVPTATLPKGWETPMGHLDATVRDERTEYDTHTEHWRAHTHTWLEAYAHGYAEWAHEMDRRYAQWGLVWKRFARYLELLSALTRHAHYILEQIHRRQPPSRSKRARIDETQATALDQPQQTERNRQVYLQSVRMRIWWLQCRIWRYKKIQLLTWGGLHHIRNEYLLREDALQTELVKDRAELRALAREGRNESLEWIATTQHFERSSTELQHVRTGLALIHRMMDRARYFLAMAVWARERATGRWAIRGVPREWLDQVARTHANPFARPDGHAVHVEPFAPSTRASGNGSSSEGEDRPVAPFPHDLPEIHRGIEVARRSLAPDRSEFESHSLFGDWQRQKKRAQAAAHAGTVFAAHVTTEYSVDPVKTASSMLITIKTMQEVTRNALRKTATPTEEDVFGRLPHCLILYGGCNFAQASVEHTSPDLVQGTLPSAFESLGAMPAVGQIYHNPFWSREVATLVMPGKKAATSAAAHGKKKRDPRIKHICRALERPRGWMEGTSVEKAEYKHRELQHKRYDLAKTQPTVSLDSEVVSTEFIGIPVRKRMFIDPNLLNLLDYGHFDLDNDVFWASTKYEYPIENIHFKSVMMCTTDADLSRLGFHTSRSRPEWFYQSVLHMPSLGKYHIGMVENATGDDSHAIVDVTVTRYLALSHEADRLEDILTKVSERLPIALVPGELMQNRNLSPYGIKAVEHHRKIQNMVFAFVQEKAPMTETMPRVFGSPKIQSAYAHVSPDGYRELLPPKNKPASVKKKSSKKKKKSGNALTASSPAPPMDPQVEMFKQSLEAAVRELTEQQQPPVSKPRHKKAPPVPPPPPSVPASTTTATTTSAATVADATPVLKRTLASVVPPVKPSRVDDEMQSTLPRPRRPLSQEPEMVQAVHLATPMVRESHRIVSFAKLQSGRNGQHREAARKPVNRAGRCVQASGQDFSHTKMILSSDGMRELQQPLHGLLHAIPSIQSFGDDCCARQSGLNKQHDLQCEWHLNGTVRRGLREVRENPDLLWGLVLPVVNSIQSVHGNSRRATPFSSIEWARRIVPGDVVRISNAVHVFNHAKAEAAGVERNWKFTSDGRAPGTYANRLVPLYSASGSALLEANTHGPLLAEHLRPTDVEYDPILGNPFNNPTLVYRRSPVFKTIEQCGVLPGGEGGWVITHSANQYVIGGDYDGDTVLMDSPETLASIHNAINRFSTTRLFLRFQSGSDIGLIQDCVSLWYMLTKQPILPLPWEWVFPAIAVLKQYRDVPTEILTRHILQSRLYVDDHFAHVSLGPYPGQCGLHRTPLLLDGSNFKTCGWDARDILFHILPPGMSYQRYKEASSVKAIQSLWEAWPVTAPVVPTAAAVATATARTDGKEATPAVPVATATTTARTDGKEALPVSGPAAAAATTKKCPVAHCEVHIERGWLMHGTFTKEDLGPGVGVLAGQVAMLAGGGAARDYLDNMCRVDIVFGSLNGWGLSFDDRLPDIEHYRAMRLLVNAHRLIDQSILAQHHDEADKEYARFWHVVNHDEPSRWLSTSFLHVRQRLLEKLENVIHLRAAARSDAVVTQMKSILEQMATSLPRYKTTIVIQCSDAVRRAGYQQRMTTLLESFPVHLSPVYRVVRVENEDDMARLLSETHEAMQRLVEAEAARPMEERIRRIWWLHFSGFYLGVMTMSKAKGKVSEMVETEIGLDMQRLEGSSLPLSYNGRVTSYEPHGDGIDARGAAHNYNYNKGLNLSSSIKHHMSGGDKLVKGQNQVFEMGTKHRTTSLCLADIQTHVDGTVRDQIGTIIESQHGWSGTNGIFDNVLPLVTWTSAIQKARGTAIDPPCRTSMWWSRQEWVHQTVSLYVAAHHIHPGTTFRPHAVHDIRSQVSECQRFPQWKAPALPTADMQKRFCDWREVPSEVLVNGKNRKTTTAAIAASASTSTPTRKRNETFRKTEESEPSSTNPKKKRHKTTSSTHDIEAQALERVRDKRVHTKRKRDSDNQEEKEGKEEESTTTPSMGSDTSSTASLPPLPMDLTEEKEDNRSKETIDSLSLDAWRAFLTPAAYDRLRLTHRDEYETMTEEYHDLLRLNRFMVNHLQLVSKRMEEINIRVPFLIDKQIDILRRGRSSSGGGQTRNAAAPAAADDPQQQQQTCDLLPGEIRSHIRKLIERFHRTGHCLYDAMAQHGRFYGQRVVEWYVSTELSTYRIMHVWHLTRQELNDLTNALCVRFEEARSNPGDLVAMRASMGVCEPQEQSTLNLKHTLNLLLSNTEGIPRFAALIGLQVCPNDFIVRTKLRQRDMVPRNTGYRLIWDDKPVAMSEEQQIIHHFMQVAPERIFVNCCAVDYAVDVAKYIHHPTQKWTLLPIDMDHDVNQDKCSRFAFCLVLDTSRSHAMGLSAERIMQCTRLSLDSSYMFTALLCPEEELVRVYGRLVGSTADIRRRLALAEVMIRTGYDLSETKCFQQYSGQAYFLEAVGHVLLSRLLPSTHIRQVQWDSATRIVTMRLDAQGNSTLFLHALSSRPEIVPQTFEYMDVRMRPRLHGIQAARRSIANELIRLVHKLSPIHPSMCELLASCMTVDGGLIPLDSRLYTIRANTDPLTRGSLNRTAVAIRDASMQGSISRFDRLQTAGMAGRIVASGSHASQVWLMRDEAQEQNAMDTLNDKTLQSREPQTDQEWDAYLRRRCYEKFNPAWMNHYGTDDFYMYSSDLPSDFDPRTMAYRIREQLTAQQFTLPPPPTPSAPAIKTEAEPNGMTNGVVQDAATDPEWPEWLTERHPEWQVETYNELLFLIPLGVVATEEQAYEWVQWQQSHSFAHRALTALSKALPSVLYSRAALYGIEYWNRFHTDVNRPSATEWEARFTIGRMQSELELSQATIDDMILKWQEVLTPDRCTYARRVDHRVPLPLPSGVEAKSSSTTSSRWEMWFNDQGELIRECLTTKQRVTPHHDINMGLYRIRIALHDEQTRDMTSDDPEWASIRHRLSTTTLKSDKHRWGFNLDGLVLMTMDKTVWPDAPADAPPVFQLEMEWIGPRPLTLLSTFTFFKYVMVVGSLLGVLSENNLPSLE